MDVGRERAGQRKRNPAINADEKNGGREIEEVRGGDNDSSPSTVDEKDVYDKRARPRLGLLAPNVDDTDVLGKKASDGDDERPRVNEPPRRASAGSARGTNRHQPRTRRTRQQEGCES